VGVQLQFARETPNTVTFDYAHRAQPGGRERVRHVPEHFDIRVLGLPHDVHIDFTTVGMPIHKCRWLLQRRRPALVTDPPNLIVPRVLERKAKGDQTKPQTLKVSYLDKKIDIVVRPSLMARERINTPPAHQPDRSVSVKKGAVERDNIGRVHLLTTLERQETVRLAARQIVLPDAGGPAGAGPSRVGPGSVLAEARNAVHPLERLRFSACAVLLPTDQCVGAGGHDVAELNRFARAHERRAEFWPTACEAGPRDTRPAAGLSEVGADLGASRPRRDTDDTTLATAPDGPTKRLLQTPERGEAIYDA
jgi:hypothetical protein